MHGNQYATAENLFPLYISNHYSQVFNAMTDASYPLPRPELMRFFVPRAERGIILNHLKKEYKKWQQQVNDSKQNKSSIYYARLMF
jgi:hypothetical protein